MLEKKFDISVDYGDADIVDWIHSHFSNGNWDKHFEVTVSVKEIDYTEDGERVYVDEDENVRDEFVKILNSMGVKNIKDIPKDFNVHIKDSKDVWVIRG